LKLCQNRNSAEVIKKRPGETNILATQGVLSKETPLTMAASICQQKRVTSSPRRGKLVIGETKLVIKRDNRVKACKLEWKRGAKHE